jgi:AMMECR1 domain-containing protein
MAYGRYGICVQMNILTSSVVSLPFLMWELGWMRSEMLSDALVVCGIMSTGNFSVCSETKLVLCTVLSEY